jgi:hypothetical protein
MEDFVPFAHRSATQVFYQVLRELNGPASQLETSDCAYRAPKPHREPNSPLALCAIGRVYVLYWDLRLNCIPAQVSWLCDNLMLTLRETDPTLTAAQGVVAFTRVKILYTALSKGEWRTEGFEAPPNDTGHGEQVTLSYFAYGDTDDQLDENLARAFRNISVACSVMSTEISRALNARER